ncbi:hypothetical protein [Microbulbifer thermotolerans]|uniref:Lipoprotein n=2 Tax=Microbulbifer thermotolerans TaxID=252514 RepID=A0A143HLQ9_MICTH|nr:hypothetical protein [Microbulbifer thermotolerans]AMX02400.1 hypothetical protein A3224_07220 [Microbulbifer thermotolerans]WKT62015.1 hypothetical protein Q2E61_07425 [Microbulbifer thermotolerans]
MTMKMLHSSIILSLALLVTACASADTASRSMAEAWASGKAIVVTLNSSLNKTDETYGDFSYYLNDFAVSAGDNWAFFVLNSLADSSELPIELNVIATPCSVLFVKRGEPQGYIHLGPILEPQVYDFVQRKFEGRDISDYLYQFSPLEVQVRWEDQGGVLKVNEKS